jgi:hypothetical protein
LLVDAIQIRYDFFGDLRRLGLEYRVEHEKEELAEAITDAWQRLGAVSLDA